MKKLFIIGLIGSVVSNVEAFDFRDYKHPAFQRQYRAFRFSPVESDRIIGAMQGGASIMGALAFIPGAAPWIGTIAAALGAVGGYAKLCTLKGTGFSVNVPIDSRGCMQLGGGGVPFLWANK